MLMNTGAQPVQSKNGLLTTIAWGINGEVHYALEGSVFIAGAAIQWLRDEMKILDEAPDSEYFNSKVSDTGGVQVFCICTSALLGYVCSKALASQEEAINTISFELPGVISYQTRDVLQAMESDAGLNLNTLSRWRCLCKQFLNAISVRYIRYKCSTSQSH